jgi:hypothetical protein
MNKQVLPKIRMLADEFNVKPKDVFDMINRFYPDNSMSPSIKNTNLISEFHDTFIDRSNSMYNNAHAQQDKSFNEGLTLNYDTIYSDGLDNKSCSLRRSKPKHNTPLSIQKTVTGTASLAANPSLKNPHRWMSSPPAVLGTKKKDHE